MRSERNVYHSERRVTITTPSTFLSDTHVQLYTYALLLGYVLLCVDVRYEPPVGLVFLPGRDEPNIDLFHLGGGHEDMRT